MKVRCQKWKTIGRIAENAEGMEMTGRRRGIWEWNRGIEVFKGLILLSYI